MSEESPVYGKEEDKYAFIWDKEEDRRFLILKIPVNEVAKSGTDALIFMYGFFEHAKSEAAVTVMIKKKQLEQQQKKKIITPENGHIPLVVH